MFFTRSPKAAIASTFNRRHRASTSSATATPILVFKKISRSAAKVTHWWSDRKALRDPIHESLPSCGFFTPSASYIPVNDTSTAVDLPWTTLTPPESDSTDTFTGHGSILGRTGGPTASHGCVHSRRRALMEAQGAHPYTHTPFEQMQNVTDLAGEEQAVDKITKENTKVNAKRPLNLKHMGYQPLDLQRRANKLIKRQLTAKTDKKDEGNTLSAGWISV